MKDIITNLTEQFRQRHREARRYVAMLLVLALVTTLFVNWQLHGVGISMTADYHCGYEEHQHTEACYEKVLTCGYEEGEPEDPEASSLPEEADLDPDFGVDAEPEYELQTQTILVPHIHTDACYEEQQELTCFEEEHEHTDDCFDEEGALICGKFEHVHDDSCYTTEDVLVCGKEDGELDEEEVTYEVPVSTRPIVIEPAAPAEDTNEETVHHHTDACYTEELVCTIPEHHHTVECLADEQVDVETPEEWQAAANVTLNGSWPEDLVAVAKSQLGYQESEKNFKLDTEDQATVHGYSRYGAWYGNPYGEWDVMFRSYCLQFAGVPQTAVPQRAGVQALHSELRGSPWLTDGDGTTAQVGDLVIYNLTSTEQVVVNEDAGIALLDLDTGLDADTNMAPDLDADMAVETAQPEVEDRVVTDETVGIVVGMDPDTGDLTVISGDVEGQVAQLTLTPGEVTSVISVTGAYAAEDSIQQPVSTEDEDVSATVTIAGESSGIAQVALYSGDRALDSHITSLQVQKLSDDGKTWETISSGATLKDGDQIRLTIDYSLAKDVISQDNPSLTYQLPTKGLQLNETKTGPIKQKGTDKEVGQFTIDENGLVTLTFTDQTFLNGAPFDGTFQFKATLHHEGDKETFEVNFGDKFTMEIEKVKDLTLTKTYANSKEVTPGQLYYDDNGNVCIWFDVTASSVHGTDKEKVNLTDTLLGTVESRFYLADGSYDESNIQLYKVDSKGTKTPMDNNNWKLTTNSDGRPTIEANGLPALEAGESYLLRYMVKIPREDLEKDAAKYPQIRNTAHAEAGEITANITQKVSFDKKRIEKSGNYDASTGLIEWTIIVRTPLASISGSYLAGTTLRDDLPEGITIPAGENVVISVGSFRDEVDGQKFLEDGYTFPERVTTSQYTITFRSTVPADGSSVTNKATLKRGENGTVYEADDTVKNYAGKWGLTKTHVKTEGDIAYWNLTATNSTGDSSFTLVDTLHNAVDTAGKTIDGSHYAYADELQLALEQYLQLTLLDNTTLDYSEAKQYLTVTYYNADGSTVQPEDHKTKVMSFAIAVDMGTASPARILTLTEIPTREDRTNTPEGETWTYKNEAEVRKDSKTVAHDSAEDSYKSYKKFEKLVSTDNRETYNEGSTVDYKEVKDQRLRYKIELTTDANPTENIEIVDTLPDGTSFDAKSPKNNALYIDDVQIPFSGQTDNHWTLKYDESTRTVTVTVNKDSTALQDGKPHQIRYEYEARFKDDPAWNDPSTSQVTYTNNASWGKEHDSTRTTVTREATVLTKIGEQVGNTNRIKYRVVINPTGADLSANGGDTVTLRDKLSPSQGAQASGIRSTVKLYEFEYENDKVQLGAQLSSSRYTIEEPAAGEEAWLVMKIPNHTALVLEYECEVDPGDAVTPSVTNEVTIEDKYTSGDYKPSLSIDASATASRGQLLLNKTNSYTGAPLAGATFQVSEYVAGTGWKTVNAKTTEADGQLLWYITGSGNDGSLQPDKLYRIVETKEPDGYLLDSKPRYFIFNMKDETEEIAFQKATGADSELTVDGISIKAEDVIFNTSSSMTTVNVPNSYNKLTVHKVWLDQATNHEINAPVDEIEVQLYSYRKDSPDVKTAVGSLVTLKATEGWSYTWEKQDIPAKDTDGTPLYYVVQEVTTGNWIVTDRNNEGISTGEIVLTNTVFDGYELPSTGGMGTAPFAVLGGLTAAGAALLLVRRRKKDLPVQEKESEE